MPFMTLLNKKNTTKLNVTTDLAIATIEKKHKVDRLDNADFYEIKVNGTKLVVEHYNIGGIGHLSVIRSMDGMTNIMGMIITPTKKNLPLFFVDFAFAPFSKKTIIEMLDLVAKRDREYKGYMEQFENIMFSYKDIDDVEHKPQWYEYLIGIGYYKKNGKDERINKMLFDNLELYLKMADNLPALSDEEYNNKVNITKNYVDGLMTRGGAPVDQIRHSLGTDKTRRFLHEVLFGV